MPSKHCKTSNIHLRGHLGRTDERKRKHKQNRKQKTKTKDKTKQKVCVDCEKVAKKVDVGEHV